MDNKYIIHVDDDNNILSVAYTFDYSENDIELSESEYEQALKHKKFNPVTREFSEPIEEGSVVNEVETLIKETHETTQTVAGDNLLNMELISTLDDKLNLIMEHLGLC